MINLQAPQEKIYADFAPAFYGLLEPHLFKVYYGGRGGAKAIDMNEWLPVPSGWRRMGDIRVGDTVFDESGEYCRVTEIHQSIPEKAYRITFDDEIFIDCCDNHEWVTWRKTDLDVYAKCIYNRNWPKWRDDFGNGPRIRTTDVLRQTLNEHHSIPKYNGMGHRTIKSIEEIPGKPMRCLAVDGPHHMYLVTKHMIPTHNSWQFARALISIAYTQHKRILCAREYQSAIADSVHQVLSSQIRAMGLSQWFNVIQRSIVSRTTGSEFFFKGLHHNAQEIKSTEDVDICWVEEAEAVGEDSWEVLLPTVLRNKGSEVWISFNPLDEESPTYKRWVTNPPPETYGRKVSWRDNPRFPDELNKLRQYMERTDNDAYQNVWEGFPRRISEATIFRGRFFVETFELPEKSPRFFYGSDWGFANDPTVLIRCWINTTPDGDDLMIDHEAYGIGIEIDDLPAFFAGGQSSRDPTVVYTGVPLCRDWPIKADSSRPETISYVRSKGFAITAADKWTGCVEDGIVHLKAFRRIVIHPRCRWTAEEFRLYSYKIDRQSGVILPIVVDAHNHVVDSLRYALDGYIQKRGGLGVWERL